MHLHPSCCILSFDYLDFDVFLNVRVFYRLAGYHITSTPTSSDLLVVLRGLPTKVYSDFKGIIHIYDYVREHSIDYRSYFPSASFIYLISLELFSNATVADKKVYAYLPIVPQIWLVKTTFLSKNPRPVHIANYKPISNDPYQQQLVSLIESQYVKVYGDKWDRLNISTYPLSYLSANTLLSKTAICYGLMYPYQRGSSLSGRMWQAPIQGCRVVSEAGTNIFSCPGIVEVSDFRTGLYIQNDDPSTLSAQAINFWTDKTLTLAADLNLVLHLKQLRFEVAYARFLLIKHHVAFGWERNIQRRTHILRQFLLRTVKSLFSN